MSRYGLATFDAALPPVPIDLPHDGGIAPEPFTAPRGEQLEEWCERYYAQVSSRVHRLLDRDLRRGRPWLGAVLSTGDIVHEVFLGVVRDFESFRGRSEHAFVAYLARLVHNRLIDAVRHHEASRRDQRRLQRDVTDMCDPEVSPGSKLTCREDAGLLATILLRLTDRDRALLRGRLEDDESFQVLAKSLGYASADSARKMFRRVQARVLAMLQLAKENRA